MWELDPGFKRKHYKMNQNTVQEMKTYQNTEPEGSGGLESRVMAHNTYNPSIQEGEAGSKGQPPLNSEFRASLDYTRPCFKQKKN